MGSLLRAARPGEGLPCAVVSGASLWLLLAAETPAKAGWVRAFLLLRRNLGLSPASLARLQAYNRTIQFTRIAVSLPARFYPFLHIPTAFSLLTTSLTLPRRFLRAPPPAPEHLLFLRRLLSPLSSSPDPTLSILVLAPSQRAPWLWPGGMPKKASMRVKVSMGEEGEKEEVVERREGEEKREGEKVLEEEEEEEEEEEDEEEATPLSQMIDALDLGL